MSIFHCVQTLGNHEFDDSIEGIAPFLDVIKSPIVLANIDTTNEPTLQGKFQNSTVLQRGNRRIGIIGVLTSDTQVKKIVETIHSLFIIYKYFFFHIRNSRKLAN